MSKRWRECFVMAVAVSLFSAGVWAADPLPPTGGDKPAPPDGPGQNAASAEKNTDERPKPPGQADDATPASKNRSDENAVPKPSVTPPAGAPDRTPRPAAPAAQSPRPDTPSARTPNRDSDNRPSADRNESPDGRDVRQPARADDRRDAGSAIRRQANRPLSTDRDQRPARRDGDAGVRDYAARFSNFGLMFDVATGGNGSLVISSIGPRGYFVDAGFRQGDRIVAAGGQRFNDQLAFYRWLGTVQVGQRVAIVVVRNNREETIYWTPTQEFVAAYAKLDVPGPQISFLGIHLDEQIDDAAVVASVDRDSPADLAGVRQDDVVVAINGEQVASRADFDRVITSTNAQTPVDMHVSRTLALRIGESQPVQQTGTVEAVVPAQPAVVVPAEPQPVRVQRAPPRGGLFRRGR